MGASFFKKLRHDLYYNHKFVQYLWLRYDWHKRRQSGKSVSDRDFAVSKYRSVTGKNLDLDNPTTFDEKLWYLKLNNRDPLLTICSDKYRVREYVEQCGLGGILNELYGVWDDAKKIDFAALPSPCFLKCNHTSGTNIIYDRGKEFDKRDFIRTFHFMLKQNYYFASREWNYKNIETRIIAEKVLRDRNGNLPLDYKFMCFGGVPKIMYLSKNTCKEDGHRSGAAQMLNYYDMDFNLLDISGAGLKNIDEEQEKPSTWEEMKRYAAILSKPFPFCRVDFYSIDGKVYFGEITFYPTGGCQNLQPEKWEILLGEWIDITGVKKTEGEVSNTNDEKGKLWSIISPDQ